MENRLRNEITFNKLVDQIEKKASYYYGSTIFDLRTMYRNTNPFYLYSDTFYGFLLRFLEGVENNRNFDVRKCVKELTQELTFYKIACPMKHLRLSDSNLNTSVLPFDESETKNVTSSETDKNLTPTPSSEIKKCSVLPSSVSVRNVSSHDVVLKDNIIGANSTQKENINEVIVDNSQNNLQLQVSCPNNNEVDDRNPNPQKICMNLEATLVDTPRNNTNIIPSDITESPTAATSDRMMANVGTNSAGKRKIGEVIMMREEECSRKKTSSGLRIERSRKPQNDSEKVEARLSPQKPSEEAIFILDDDDDDVIIKSCNVKQPIKNVQLPANNVKTPTESSRPESHITKAPSTVQQVPVKSDVRDTRPNDDDDVLIVEDVGNVARQKKPVVTPSCSSKQLQTNSQQPQESHNGSDDLIVVSHYNQCNTNHRINKNGQLYSSLPNATGEVDDNDDDDVCILYITTS